MQDKVAPPCTASLPASAIKPEGTPVAPSSTQAVPSPAPQPAHATLQDVWASTCRPVTQSSNSTHQWLCCLSWSIIWMLLVAAIRVCVVLAPVCNLPHPPPLPACLTPPAGHYAAHKRWKQSDTLQLSAQSAVQSCTVWFSRWVGESMRRGWVAVMFLLVGCFLGANCT